MSESPISQPWDLTPVFDLIDRLSIPSTNDSSHEFPYFDYTSPKNDELARHGCASSSLGDFTPIWNHLYDGASPPRQEFNDKVYESASSAVTSSCFSGGVFSGPDALPSPLTDESNNWDLPEIYVGKSKEVRWVDEPCRTGLPEQQRQSTPDLESDSAGLISSEEQVLPPKESGSSPFAADHLFAIQSPILQKRRQARQQKLYSNLPTDESSGLESEVEKASRLNPASPLIRFPVVHINDDLESGVIHPLYNLTFGDKKSMIVEKLSNHFLIDKNTLLNTPTTPKHSTDPEAIHVFVDYSNIIIGFHQALRLARSIPERVRIKFPPFSYLLLAFILERNRPVARRILAGSKQSHTTELPTHFAQAQECGYETNIMDRVWKNRESTPKKALRGRGNGYLNGQSSGSDTSYSNIPVKAYQEQGVDELLHMKLLETLVDTKRPSTIVLATGDGAEAEYSAGFFRNVERALERGWKVEIVAWKNGLSYEYRSQSFRQKWRRQFTILLLNDFCEELLAIHSEEEAPP
ncbi:hypothetical protein DSL72_003307 [Monilinia vaccinii-corymbosi]|uniref:NYN domain-containing protein n=1 Tax=Monilinia vaccinii-corymbosi TaxID=61207 RepID=A0A8A3NWI8_9HELO|nr:hypothetical protein DSL72_003307 [Monilinia vaccinii-corymbosi]